MFIFALFLQKVTILISKYLDDFFNMFFRIVIQQSFIYTSVIYEILYVFDNKAITSSRIGKTCNVDPCQFLIFKTMPSIIVCKYTYLHSWQHGNSDFIQSGIDKNGQHRLVYLTVTLFNLQELN